MKLPHSLGLRLSKGSGKGSSNCKQTPTSNESGERNERKRLLPGSKDQRKRAHQRQRATQMPGNWRNESPQAWASSSLAKLKGGLLSSLNLVLAVVLLAVAMSQVHQTVAAATGATTGEEDKVALERELNSLMREQNSQDADSKLLSEAIISRLMVGNLSESATSGPEGASSDLDGVPELSQPAGGGETVGEPPARLSREQLLDGLRATRPRDLLSYLLDLETHGGLAEFPVLPAGQAATIKRASKVGGYLRQQQLGQQRQLNNYGRNFDFGLGKRPDGGVGGSILRFGDTLGAPVSGQFGKRPSAHRYDFGLGKRVASVSDPNRAFEYQVPQAG